MSLVLSRKEGQSIVIGDNVTITVQQVKGGKVSLAVDAPREIPVLRSDAKNVEPKNRAA